MTFKLALAQTKHPEDGDVVSMVKRYTEEAATAGASLIAFPECLMTPFGLPAEEFRSLSEPLEGPFATSMEQIAAKNEICLLHALNEQNPSGKPFNTLVLLDSDGNRRSVYRKIHLFDSGINRESLKMSAGDELPKTVEAPFGKLSAAICYDLRFPEIARAMALDGAQLILFPAAWVDGPGKADQWRALLKARAIENECFVAGLSSCDKNRIGQSIVFDPQGKIVAEAGLKEDLLVCEIDLELVEKVRNTMPVFEHRRPDVY